jgi:hypothetical protein
MLRLGALFLAIECLMPGSGHAQCRLPRRRITVADTIAMTEIAFPEVGSKPDRTGLFSPDYSHFAIVLRKGDLSNNTNVYSLLIFATEAALSSHQPEDTVVMPSNSNRPAISDLEWIRNGSTLMFLGERPGQSAQIYSFDLQSRRLRRLTSHNTSIVRFSASTDGRVIVFEADPPPHDILDTPAVRRGGFVVRGEALSTLLFSGYSNSQSTAFLGRQLFMQTGAEKPRRINTADALWPSLPLSVSPDGRYALIGAMVRHIPQQWRLYSDPLLHELIAQRKPFDSVAEVESYLLLNTETARLSSLLGTPKDWPNDDYMWFDGGRSLVISHAYLPLSGVTDGERALRENRRFVVEVAMPSRTIEEISPGDLRAEPVRGATGEIALSGTLEGRSVRRMFRRQGVHWAETGSAPDRILLRPAIAIVQDMNTPPAVWLSDPGSGRRVELINLSLQFEPYCLGGEKEIAWKATDGHEVLGGLYLPPNYTPGKRYPLVIQTHAFDPHQFWVDGPWNSAFAAQPLAAHDIVVLQIGYDHTEEHTPGEGPRAMAAIDGAINYLTQQGITDPSRVGIIGFSRTVYHVAYTLTHSRHSFTAATLADGFDGDFFQDVAFPSTVGAETDAVNGGPPWGATLGNWLKTSPLFNIAAIATPIRLESYGMNSVLTMWSWYSLLTRRAMPVDMIILPEAPHELVRPWDRMVSQQGNVDWFTFWLCGTNEVSSVEAGQYVRWQRMRALLDRDASSPQTGSVQ